MTYFFNCDINSFFDFTLILANIYATIINQIFIEDLPIIYDIYKDEETKVVIYENYKISRLMSTGLLSNYSGAITVQELANGKSGVRNIFEKNGLGELFVKIATKKENVKKIL